MLMPSTRGLRAQHLKAKILQSEAKPLVCGEINGKIKSSVFALYVHILRAPAASLSLRFHLYFLILNA